MSDVRGESTDLDSDKPYVPGTSGWPTWDLEAEKILKGIRYWVQKGGEEGEVAYVDFLKILDAFVSQLIDWTEQEDLPEIRQWAGRELADRLQFLWTQRSDWCSENEGFQKRWSEFADKRHVRSPRSYIGWLTGDYLRELHHERLIAGALLSPSETGKKSASIAEVSGYPNERILWLKKLCALSNFSPKSALEWATIVFERMQEDERKILDSPEMRKCKTRDSSERRRSGEIRLYDFKKTIIEAVVRLASKPVGQIRGITRPGY